VLHAILDYIMTFPEQLHHPKEERYLFRAIRERSGAAVPLLDRLQEEHVQGGRLIRLLRSALTAFELDAATDKKFQSAVEEYVDFHWDHMRREEAFVLPLAEQVLHESDWIAIAQAFKENDSPVSGLKPREQLDHLFRRIVLLAPAPIGVGPVSVVPMMSAPRP
jgi:hemerythrin-like domain-containing protein